MTRKCNRTPSPAAERTMGDIDAAAEFSQGERLLLRTVRMLALQSGCRSQKYHFELACGCAGDEAYRALGAFVAQLRFNGRRRGMRHKPVRTRTGSQLLAVWTPPSSTAPPWPPAPAT